MDLQSRCNSGEIDPVILSRAFPYCCAWRLIEQLPADEGAHDLVQLDGGLGHLDEDGEAVHDERAVDLAKSPPRLQNRVGAAWNDHLGPGRNGTPRRALEL